MTDPGRSGEMTKARLLELVRTGRLGLEATVAKLDEERLTRPGTVGEWSAKDTLAHIAAWERHLIALLRASRGEAEWPEPIHGSEDVDRFNARVRAEARDLPLAEVRAEFAEAHEAALREVASLDEGALLEPGRFARLEGAPLWRNVEADTYGHYREHLPALRALAES